MNRPGWRLFDVGQGFFVDWIVVVGLRKLRQLSLVNQDSLANLLRSDLFTGDEVIQRPS